MPIESLFITICVGGSAILLYHIIAFIYYVITVREAKRLSRKINKMSGLSLLFLFSQFITMILFYPITLAFFAFSVQKEQGSSSEQGLMLEKRVLDKGSLLHIILSLIMFIIWCLSLLIQILNIIFTTEFSTRRLVTWSVVQPYARLGFFGLKIIQAFFLTSVVYSPL